MSRFPNLRVKGSLRVEWLDDEEEWRVLGGVCVHWTGGEVLVPRGFKTDLSSIPEWARGIIPQVGRHNVPSVVHDFCYVTRWRTRREADDLFLALMAIKRVPWLRRNIMWAAVRAFGRRQWDDDD